MLTEEKIIIPRIQLCYDKVFKKVFRDNPNALAKLISDIIEIPYLEIKDNITFNNNELRLNHIKEKSKVCDFIVSVDNYSINIEMNMYPSKWIKYRNFAYLNNLYNGIVTTGLKYNEYSKKVAIQINFNVNYKKEELPISKCVVFDTNRCKIFIDNYYIYQVDIVKCLDIVYNEREITNVASGIRWGALLYADNLEDMKTILGNDLLEEKERKELMKTIQGIVYEGKTPDMDWDIEKDIENQIASMKAEFAEEHGEETLKEYIELNKDKYIEKFLDNNKDTIKKEYLNTNKNAIEKEYLDSNKNAIEKEYLDSNKSAIEKEYLDSNKSAIEKEYLDSNKNAIEKEYLDSNKNAIEKEYLDSNKSAIEKEYLTQLSLETKEKNTIIFIKNMLKENIPLKSIAKISNKSIEEIKKMFPKETQDLS